MITKKQIQVEKKDEVFEDFEEVKNTNVDETKTVKKLDDTNTTMLDEQGTVALAEGGFVKTSDPSADLKLNSILAQKQPGARKYFR